MAESKEMKIFKIRHNLYDAGMNETEIENCLKLIEEKKFPALEKILAKHRLLLLDRVHKYNDQIDCLDYLVYSMERKTNN